MISTLKGLSALQRVGAVLLIITVVSAMAAGGVSIYKYSIKKEVIENIKIEEDGIKHDDTKRVKNATDIVNDKPDCAKLSSVYGSDQCARRQEPSAKSTQETTATHRENIKGIGQDNAVIDPDSLRIRGVLSDDRENPRVPEKTCYFEKVSDEFGLPVWLQDADGLLVQKEVEVCAGVAPE